MVNTLPDPKTLVDSIADGVVEAAEGVPRIAANVAEVAVTFASEVKSNMDSLKTQMPDNPAVIPDILIKTAGQTVKAGLGIVDGIGRGAMDTFGAVKKQIERVTG